MRLVKAATFLTLASFMAVACGKGPAQAAITAADAAVSSARAEGEKFVPDQFKALSAAAAGAKAKFDAGDYKAALEQAQGIPAKAQEVMQLAVAKQTELMASWKTLEGSLPTMVAAIQKRVMELSVARKLPVGVDKTTVASAKVALESATSAWAAAGTAFGAGDMMAAVAKGGQVKATAEELMTRLGMASAAAATPAPAKK